MEQNKNSQMQAGQSAAKAQAGKYLTFRLASEEYGLEILKVQEIIGMLPVTRVPKMPESVRGLINLRGKLIPVIDMRKKFGLEHQADTEKTCIIVVQVSMHEQRFTLGIIVDSVSEVLNVTAEQLEPPPSIGATLDTDFILGIGKVGTKVVIILDIDRVLSGEEAANIIKQVQEK